jgi:glycoprotein-N-acetylgalactosamine 3-beta-galactosyltransferase
MALKTNQLSFLFGIFLGFLLFRVIWVQLKNVDHEHAKVNFKLIESKNNSESGVSFELYESELVDTLQNEVKIVCWINMAPKYHKTKAVHIKNLWGRHCSKLLFMSHENDPDLPAINLNFTCEDPAPAHYWKKFKLAFEYVYKHHLNDGDYFLKADDDTFIVMENLQHMLYQYRPQTALLFGHRFAAARVPTQGYMQGGCYIMSKKLFIKFMTQLLPNASKTFCAPDDGYTEDYYVG